MLLALEEVGQETHIPDPKGAERNLQVRPGAKRAVEGSQEWVGSAECKILQTQRTEKVERSMACVRDGRSTAAVLAGAGELPAGADEGGDGDRYAPHPAGAGELDARQPAFGGHSPFRGAWRGPPAGDHGAPSGSRPELAEGPA